VKRIIEQRRFSGKTRFEEIETSQASADSMVSIYRARVSATKTPGVGKRNYARRSFCFLVKAFDKLVGDENFVYLLRSRSFVHQPKYLDENVHKRMREGRMSAAKVAFEIETIKGVAVI